MREWRVFSVLFCVRSQRNLRLVSTHSLAATISQKKKEKKSRSTGLLLYHFRSFTRPSVVVCACRLLLVANKG